MTSLPSYINPELNLELPKPLDHAESDDEDRYELWTIRVPVSMKLEELNGLTVDLQALKNGRMEINDGKYVMSQGESNENETFRLLVPDENDDDNSSNSSNSDDSSDDEAKPKTAHKFLYPSRKAFSRHFNVHQNILDCKTEAELAPSVGPEPTGCILKHSYSHIPQRKGLKRRWMPLGNKQGARDLDPNMISLKADKAVLVNEDSDDASMEQAVEVKKESDKKRRRSNSRQEQEAESPKKKKRSKSKEPNVATPSPLKSKKVKKEKKSDKKKKHKKKLKKDDDDAISV